VGARLTLALALAAALATAAEAASPAVGYALQCQGCHLADGAGTPGSVPALAGSVARFVAVPGGREYLLRVPGVAQSSLDDAALAELMNWMLRRFDADHLPPDFRPYAADEVGRWRHQPLVDVEGARRALLDAMEARPSPR
jgi:hypothetical protein